ncbi:hypothetical protein ACIQRC_16515 [Streptomyces californicus]|uniref:hypothetical protein n=1 Tax=Streptomyces californicus TaxID=67351 RepID=UPI0038273695
MHSTLLVDTEPPASKAVIELFSTDRLNPYLTAGVGDRAATLALYRWTSDLAAAFFEPLGHLEIVLRRLSVTQTKSPPAASCAPGFWSCCTGTCTPRRRLNSFDFGRRSSRRTAHDRIGMTQEHSANRYLIPVKLTQSHSARRAVTEGRSRSLWSCRSRERDGNVEVNRRARQLEMG